MKNHLILSNQFSTWIFSFLMIFAAQNVAQAQFADGTFGTGWSEVLLPSSVIGSTCTAIQDTTRGNPLASRLTTHISPQGLMECAHLFSPAVYDPASQGSIVSLGYSYDLAHYTSGGVAYSILVFQDNTYYHHVPDDVIVGPVNPVNPVWTNFTGTLTDTSFTKLSGTSQNVHPDFSCTGAPFEFGYATRNSHTAGTIDRTDSGIDNWTIKINRADCPKQSTNTYAAKFICGVQQDGDITHVPDAQAGRYSTKINVHNNTGNQINFRKKVIRLRGGEVPIDPQFKIYEALKEDQAMEVVCRDIYRHLNINIPPGSIPGYIEGFVILEVYFNVSPGKPFVPPPDPLDVVGIYTYKGDLPKTPTAPASGAGVSIEVVIYPAKSNTHILD